MADRKLFSSKDGTKFFEDVRAILSEWKEAIANFVTRIFSNLRDYYEVIGEPVVMFLEGVKEVIKKGTVTGSVLDLIVQNIPGSIDDAVLQWIRDNIADVIAEWYGVPDRLDDAEKLIIDFLATLGAQPEHQADAIIHGIASGLIARYSAEQAEHGIEPVTGRKADTLAQLSYDFYRESMA